MNVLFLTLAYPEGNERNLYTDLMHEFSDRGDQVFVVCQRERRYAKPTEFMKENDIHVLRVKTGNVTKTNIVEKGISTLLVESQFKKAIMKHLGHIHFDLVLYSPPPITFEKVVKYIKSRDKCTTYLLLKDIFPQNAVDIGMIKKNSLIWRYFRAKEKRLYRLSDYIGCMSRANVNYILNHNPEIDANKVEECPNSIRPCQMTLTDNNQNAFREKYNIPKEAVVFVYGGNLGKPQGIGFFLEVLDHLKARADVFFLIVGSGTEYDRIDSHLRNGPHCNVKLMKSMPKADYDRLLENCDVGLIFLDRRFTIPNFPSRLTAYMESAMPIAAATDVNSDIKDVLAEAGCGYWAESGDTVKFISVINTLAADDQLRKQMGMHGRRYLEQHYTVSGSYEIITSHFKRDAGAIQLVQG